MSEKQDPKLLQSLKLENQHLRDVIVLLGAVLLQNIALHPAQGRHEADDAARLLHEAEVCFRCANSPGLKKEIAEGLAAAGHELMARAVEIETMLQREKRKD